MKLKHILLALTPCLFVLACKKEEIILFENDVAGIYFQQGGRTRSFINSESYNDSTAYSFNTAADTVKATTINVRIRTMGNVKDYPRPVKVSVDKENTTAIEGKHYEVDLNSTVIPAGTSQVLVPVKIHRTEDLLTQTFSITLKLEPNEHFQIPFQKQKNSNVYSSTGRQINADRYKITFGELYTQPFYWQIFGNTYFGPWTITKFKYVNSVLGWSPQDWSTAGASSSKVQLGRFGPAAITVRNALQKLADAGTPVLDENGIASCNWAPATWLFIRIIVNYQFQ